MKPVVLDSKKLNRAQLLQLKQNLMASVDRFSKSQTNWELATQIDYILDELKDQQPEED